MKQNTMKAYVRVNKANKEVKLKEVAIPQIQNDEVLIKVESFGVGIHDRYFIPEDAHFPYTIGSEGAGTIVALGNPQFEYPIGSRVIFSAVLQPQGGSWAEYAVAKYSSLILLPKNMTYSQGAAIPVAGKTAIESMNALNLKERETLFIAGASGAIGSFVIQLAEQKIVRIAASASAHNQEYMELLGAERTVDYNNSDWQENIMSWTGGKGVDAALAIHPETTKACLNIVKDGGRLVTVSGDNRQITPERYINIKQIEHYPQTRSQLIELVNSISESRIKVVIEKEYSFSKALDALEKSETLHARGKSVVVL